MGVVHRGQGRVDAPGAFRRRRRRRRLVGEQAPVSVSVSVSLSVSDPLSVAASVCAASQQLQLALAGHMLDTTRDPRRRRLALEEVAEPLVYAAVVVELVR